MAYRTTVASSTSARTVIFVAAPCNDVLGATYVQGVSPPNAAAAITTTPLVDPYITSLLTPITTSGSGGSTSNSWGVRWAEFCMEVVCPTALASVGGCNTRMCRWPQTGIPLVNSQAAPEFFSTYSSMLEFPETVYTAPANFVAAKCYHSAMRDRSALEFSQIGTGTPTWDSVYGASTAMTSIFGIGAGMPWFPLVFSATGNSLPEFEVVIKGVIEVLPPANSFLYRVGRVLPSPAPDAEAKWMARQRALATSPLTTPATQGVNRSAAGYLGVQNSRPSPPSKPNSAKPKAKPSVAASAMTGLALALGGLPFTTAAQRTAARARLQQGMRPVNPAAAGRRQELRRRRLRRK